MQKKINISRFYKVVVKLVLLDREKNQRFLFVAGSLLHQSYRVCAVCMELEASEDKLGIGT